jgi:hypothetical protein
VCVCSCYYSPVADPLLFLFSPWQEAHLQQRAIFLDRLIEAASGRDLDTIKVIFLDFDISPYEFSSNGRCAYQAAVDAAWEDEFLELAARMRAARSFLALFYGA